MSFQSEQNWLVREIEIVLEVTVQVQVLESRGQVMSKRPCCLVTLDSAALSPQSTRSTFYIFRVNTGGKLSREKHNVRPSSGR